MSVKVSLTNVDSLTTITQKFLISTALYAGSHYFGDLVYIEYKGNRTVAKNS